MGLAIMLSGRSYTQATGLPVSQAASAVRGWTETSSLPPKPPPQALGTIRTCAGWRPSTSAVMSRSMTGVWVETKSSTRSPMRRAQPASGSI